jgi:hypothetical protein
MDEMTDFFQKESQECKRLAAQATGKNDREYWLGLAERWKSLQQPAPKGALRFEHPIKRRKALPKRRAA